MTVTADPPRRARARKARRRLDSDRAARIEATRTETATQRVQGWPGAEAPDRGGDANEEKRNKEERKEEESKGAEAATRTGTLPAGAWMRGRLVSAARRGSRDEIGRAHV